MPHKREFLRESEVLAHSFTVASSYYQPSCQLRWFPSIALRISTAHDVRLISARISARAQNVSNFPQTELDSELNAPFLLNEHGDFYFLFHNFNENNILTNWEKY